MTRREELVNEFDQEFGIGFQTDEFYPDGKVVKLWVLKKAKIAEEKIAEYILIKIPDYLHVPINGEWKGATDLKTLKDSLRVEIDQYINEPNDK